MALDLANQPTISMGALPERPGYTQALQDREIKGEQRLGEVIRGITAKLPSVIPITRIKPPCPVHRNGDSIVF